MIHIRPGGRDLPKIIPNLSSRFGEAFREVEDLITPRLGDEAGFGKGVPDTFLPRVFFGD